MRSLLIASVAACALPCYASKSADECWEQVDKNLAREEQQKAVANCMLESAATSEPVSLDGPPANSPAVLEFAKRWAGKYASELPASGPGKGTLFTVNTTLSRFKTFARYDGATGQVSFVDSLSTFTNFKFARRCKNAGSYVGQNAFGAKARVQVRDCQEGVLSLPLGSEPVSFYRGFTVTPPQYRWIEAGGLEVEIVFALAPREGGLIAAKDELTDPATIDDPIEERTVQWSLTGEVKEVRALLPGGRRAVLYQQ